MKKQTITLLIPIAIGMALSTGASAQFTLQGDEAPFYQVVKEPYFFYDLMRYNHNAWVRQYRESTSQAWGNSNLLINRKDADGRFNYLEYSLWNFNTQQWTVYNKYVTNRQKDGNKLVKESKSSWFTDDQASSYFSQTETDITWENNRMKQAATLRTNASGQQSINTQYFSYDAAGRLVNDSSSFNDVMFWEDRYVYDAAGNCISGYMLMNGDTLSWNAYEYTGNQLTRSRYYDYQQPPLLLNEQTYTYDASGNVSEAVISGEDEEGFRELSRYKHGYSNAGKLLWMCSYYHQDGEWNKSDSVAITYTGDKADTSYGYVSENMSDWNSWPSFRFLFDEDRVGVNEKPAPLDVALYPNPAQDKISIQLKNGAAATHVSILDLAGKAVLNISNPGNDVDVSTLAKGLYFVKVTSGTQQGIKKLAIE